MLFLPTDDPVVRERVIQSMMTVPDHVAIGCFRGMTVWPGVAAIKAVSVPAPCDPRSSTDQRARGVDGALPSLTNAQTPGVGHFNQLLAPSEVNRLIEEFIA